MRKIDAIANEKFNGNTKAAIEYLLFNLGKGEFDAYIDELTEEEASFVLDIVERETIKKAGGLENYSSMLKREQKIFDMDMTYDEVKNAEKNPFKTKIFKSVLTLLMMEGGIAALTLLGVNPAAMGMAAAIGSGMLSMTIATNIINYVKFKNVKKSIDAEILDDEQVSRGRGL